MSVLPMYHFLMASGGMLSASWMRSKTFPGMLTVSARYEVYAG